ncbi:MAG: hypothetical protein ABIP89_13100, partial [Polyangiaceae bacterium]
WCELDHARALLPVDHEIIDSTRALRTLVVDLFHDSASARADTGPARDLFNACAMLGRMIAERGGSPTGAMASMHHADRALGLDTIEASAERELREARWFSARAALAEGFAAARTEMARKDAAASWEFPRCAVAIGESTMAFAAGYPDDDGEALAAWAGRVANAAVRGGARRAIVTGREDAKRALVDALSTIGVEVVPTLEKPETGRRSWLPWNRTPRKG